MRTRFTTFLAAALCLLAFQPAGAQRARDLSLSTPTASDRRLALVIGNDAYPRSPLVNARNDARAMGSALRDLGFTVTSLENGTRQQTTGAIARFEAGLTASDVAFFFYAGHGLQVDGENFLVPVDFAGDSATAVRLNALSVSELQNAIGKAKVSIVVLDACRNNPFLASRGGGAGLAPVEARGNLIAFATGAGQTASDSGGGNGLFTQQLLGLIRQPDLSIRDVFFRVRQKVYEASGGKQFPAVYDGLLGDITLRTGTVAASAPPAGAKPTGGAKPTAKPAAATASPAARTPAPVPTAPAKPAPPEEAPAAATTTGTTVLFSAHGTKPFGGFHISKFTGALEATDAGIRLDLPDYQFFAPWKEIMSIESKRQMGRLGRWSIEIQTTSGMNQFNEGQNLDGFAKQANAILNSKK
jgi:hypothetical protein